jgi:hypothetical protein
MKRLSKIFSSDKNKCESNEDNVSIVNTNDDNMDNRSKDKANDKEADKEDSKSPVSLRSNKIVDNTVFRGVLTDIGDPTNERYMTAYQKDLRTLMSESINLSDPMINIRAMFLLCLRYNENETHKILEFLRSYRTTVKDRNIKILTYTYLLYIVTEKYCIVNIDSYMLDNSVDCSADIECLGFEGFQVILRTIANGTYNKDMEFIKKIIDYADKKVIRSQFKTDTMMAFYNCYTKRFGYSISINYISLLYRVSSERSDKFNKDIGRDSYELFGIYDYRTYSKRGLLYDKIATNLLTLKNIDSACLLAENIENTTNTDKSDIQID